LNVKNGRKNNERIETSPLELLNPWKWSLKRNSKFSGVKVKIVELE
jgi:hypothetical protein